MHLLTSQLQLRSFFGKLSKPFYLRIEVSQKLCTARDWNDRGLSCSLSRCSLPSSLHNFESKNERIGWISSRLYSVHVRNPLSSFFFNHRHNHKFKNEAKDEGTNKSTAHRDKNWEFSSSLSTLWRRGSSRSSTCYNKNWSTHCLIASVKIPQILLLVLLVGVFSPRLALLGWIKNNRRDPEQEFPDFHLRTATRFERKLKVKLPIKIENIKCDFEWGKLSNSITYKIAIFSQARESFLQIDELNMLFSLIDSPKQMQTMANIKRLSWRCCHDNNNVPCNQM